MRIAGLRDFTALVRRALEFIRKHGIGITISRVLSKFKPEKKYPYTALLNKFPQKFGAQPHISINNKSTRSALIEAAQAPLTRVLNQLNLQADPIRVLSAFRDTFKESKYHQALDDLFTYEQFLEKTSSNSYPLIQASELPGLDKNPHKRRILFITAQMPHPHHGGGNRVLNFMKILSENNDVYLATIYYPGEDDQLLNDISVYCRAVHGIPYWRFGNNQAEIRRWLNNVPIDIVHYEWADALKNYDPTAGRIQIFTYMEAVSLRLLMDMEKLPPLSPIWLDTFAQFLHALRLEIADSAQLDARIAVTTKDGDFLRSLYPQQAYTVLNHGVNLSEFSLPDVEPEPQALLFVGNFGHYPNIDAMTYFFSEIWDGILKEVPNTRIYLVGPNPPGEITRYADGQQVIITGSVPDVRPYIQKATICIAPLITGAGLRGKVIEYAALKRTFVATSIATTDLLFDDQTDYMRANLASDFTQKVVTLLKDKDLRDKMAESAYEVVQQNYDTRRLVQFLYRLYAYLEQEQPAQ